MNLKRAYHAAGARFDARIRPHGKSKVVSTYETVQHYCVYQEWTVLGKKRIKEFALRRGMASGCEEPVVKKEKCENLYHQSVQFSVFRDGGRWENGESGFA